MSTNELVDSFVEKALNAHNDEMRRILSWAESPIERLMLAALLADGWSLGGPSFVNIDDREASRVLCDVGAEENSVHQSLINSTGELVVFVQPTVHVGGKRFRPDLAVVSQYHEAFAIELDGHDFHERTKEQARKDRSRERAFIAAGWQVLRFTGSEVYEDAEACVEEVYGIAFRRLASESA